MKRMFRYLLYVAVPIILLFFGHYFQVDQLLFNEHIEGNKQSFQIMSAKELPNSGIKNSNYKIVEDSKKSDLNKLLTEEKVVYRIKYPHAVEHLNVPKDCEIFFDGGKITGDITFNNTLLSGKVNVVGSVLSGSIANTCFQSGWLCYGDGIHDDAANINNMLSVCDSVYFQSGIYLLESLHKQNEELPAKYLSNCSAHIGIFTNDKCLIGESNVQFLTKDKEVTICIYSKPYAIDSSVCNIIIENITFTVKNDKDSFNEFKHTIKTIGVNGLCIRNCKFEDFWGDAICLSHYGDNSNTGERTRNMHVTIKDNYIYGGSHNNRNGISIISGEHVIVDNNVIEELSKSGMPGGIDIEPNSKVYTAKDIWLTNNTIRNCKGSAGINVNANRHEGTISNVEISGNLVSGSTYGLCFVAACDSTATNFRIIRNTIESDTKPYGFYGDAICLNWTFEGNDFRRVTTTRIPGKLKIKNLIVR